MRRGLIHAWIAMLLLVQQVCGIGVLRVHPFCPGATPCDMPATAVEVPAVCCRGSNGPGEAAASPCVRGIPPPSEGCTGLALDGAAGCTPCCRYTMGLGSAIMPAQGAAKHVPAPEGHQPAVAPAPFQLAAIAHAALRPHAPPVPAFVEGRVRRAMLCVRTI